MRRVVDEPDLVDRNARFAASMAAWQQRRDRRRAVAEEFRTARRFGLMRRHAEKLVRVRRARGADGSGIDPASGGPGPHPAASVDPLDRPDSVDVVERRDSVGWRGCPDPPVVPWQPGPAGAGRGGDATQGPVRRRRPSWPRPRDRAVRPVQLGLFPIADILTARRDPLRPADPPEPFDPVASADPRAVPDAPAGSTDPRAVPNPPVDAPAPAGRRSAPRPAADADIRPRSRAGWPGRASAATALRTGEAACGGNDPAAAKRADRCRDKAADRPERRSWEERGWLRRRRRGTPGKPRGLPPKQNPNRARTVARTATTRPCGRPGHTQTQHRHLDVSRHAQQSPHAPSSPARPDAPLAQARPADTATSPRPIRAPPQA